MAAVTVKPSQFGECLRLLREARGLTQDDLAAKAGISSEPIQRVEQKTARIRAFGWHRRTLMLVAAALHKAAPLSDKDFERLLMAAKIPAQQHRDVESTVRRMAGEFDGLQDRLQAQSRKLGDDNLAEFARMQPTETFYVQALVTELCARFPVPRVFHAILGLKSQLEAETRAIPPAKVPLAPNLTELVDRTPRPKSPKPKR